MKGLRKTGIILTAISLIIGGAMVAFYISNMVTHARADSEGGVFIYGMVMMYYLTLTMLATFISAVIWGFGIRRSRDVAVIGLTETVVQRALLVISTLWLGFILYHIVAARY